MMIDRYERKLEKEIEKSLMHPLLGMGGDHVGMPRGKVG